MGQPVALNASAYFTDPDGDALIYSAATSDTGVVTVSVSASTVTATGVAAGTVIVTVTVRDSAGLSAQQSFAVTAEWPRPEANLSVIVPTSPEGGTVILEVGFTPPEVARTPLRDLPITVSYTLGVDDDPSTADADATDYASHTSGVIEIGTETNSAVLEIAIHDDDNIEPTREVFTVTLGAPSAGASYELGSATSVVLTIAEGVCDRTEQVSDEIVQQVEVGDCVEVEDRHLASIQRFGFAPGLITTLREGDFDGLSSMVSLTLGQSQLIELPPGVFSGLIGLQRLFLFSTPLTELPEGVFSGLYNLKVLQLADNRLTELPAGVFSDLSSMTQLQLYDNQLTELPEGVFSGLPSLTYLDLSGNPGSPFPLEVAVARIDSDNPMSSSPATLEVGVAEGAPFAITIPLSARGGRLSTSSVSFAAGATVATEATLTPDGSGAASVVVGPVPTVCRAGTATCKGLEIVAGSPLVVANPETVALSVRAAHLTQATQDLNGGVPLIAGREALLRVFATVDEHYAIAGGGQATFFIRGQEVYRASLELPPSGIPLDVAEGRLRQSYNARIPGHVLQPGLQMVVELDTDEVLPLTPGSGSRFPASGRLAIDVRNVPPLRLTIVPVLYQSAANRSTNPEIEDITRDMVSTDSDGALRYIRDILPIGDLNVNLREPYFTSADTHERGAFQIIRELVMLRHLEAGRDEYYHGIYAVPNTEGLEPDPNWPDAIGALPGYTSVSAAIDRSFLGYLIAHELGHNLSLGHAPCGDPLNIDPEFPYADGSIRVWGHRFARDDDTGFGRLLDPEGLHDLMSYCYPRWISDYNFTKALGHRLGLAFAPPLFAERAVAQQTLLLWGGVQDGELRLEPAFAHSARLKFPEASGPYQLTGLDAEGRSLFSLRFTPDELDHGGSSFLFGVPFEPEWTEDLDRITLTGPEGSTTLDRDTGGRAALIVDSTLGRVRTIARDWTSGDGALPAAMPANAQVEVIRGLPRR